jgi:hypothetical protein
MVSPGNFIGNYRILTQLLHDTSSSSYLAEHTSLSSVPVVITLWHDIMFITSEDCIAFKRQSEFASSQESTRVLPIIDSGTKENSPYIVTVYNDKALNLLRNYVTRINQATQAAKQQHPNNSHALVKAFLHVLSESTEKNDAALASLAGNSSCSFQQSISENGPHGPQKRSSMGSRSLQNSRWKTWTLVAFLLVVVVGSGMFLFTVLPATAATVTITPARDEFIQTYHVAVVQGNPRNLQVKGHVVSYASPQQSQTVTVTGKGHHDATQATGMLTISQVHFYSPSDAGTPIDASVIDSTSGVSIAIDHSFDGSEGGSVTVSAHATNPGSGGNISAYNIDGIYYIDSIINGVPTGTHIGTAYVQNPQDFTGGQDARDYTFLQQLDIDGVANRLEGQLTPDAQTKAKQLIQPGEMWVKDIQCSPNVTANHNVNDETGDTTINVIITCSGEVVSAQAMLLSAVDAHKADAIARFGNGYRLVGDIITGTPIQSSPVDMTYTIRTDGIWVFLYDLAQKQQIAQLIAGRSQINATNLLLEHKDIHQVVIHTNGGLGSALPTSPRNIRIILITITGLHANNR